MIRTAVELFSGAAGGWALGLSWAGIETVAGCEKDPDRAAAYVRRWRVPVLDDVRTAHRQLQHVRPWLLCGSPPCQDASEINRSGKGVDGDETGLFFDAIDLAARIRPAWLAFENVGGLRTRGADRLLLRMEGVGYSPRSIVVGSDCAGMDHRRERVFIVATDAARPQGRAARQPWSSPRGPLARWDGDAGPEDRRSGVGHVRSDTLGRHLQPYDGVPARLAERARSALGDSLDPAFPFAIARALIAWEDGAPA